MMFRGIAHAGAVHRGVVLLAEQRRRERLGLGKGHDEEEQDAEHRTGNSIDPTPPGQGSRQRGGPTYAENRRTIHRPSRRPTLR